MQDKHIDLEKVEFTKDRLYILSKGGDLWGMGLNKNFGLRSNMDHEIDNLERLDLQI